MSLTVVLLGCALLLCCVHGAAISSAQDVNALYTRNLLKNVNTSVDPCEDFYAYACGNWAQHYEAHAYVDMPGYMDHKVNRQLLETLQPQSHGKQPEGESVVQKLAATYYESCTQLKAPALNSFLRLVQRALHFKWPIFREQNISAHHSPWLNVTEFDWLRVLGGLRVYGLNGVFITQNVNTRVSNGSHYLIELHAHQSQQMPLQQRALEHIFVSFGLAPAEALNISRAVIALEQRMQNVSALSVLLNDGNEASNDTAGSSKGKLNITSLELNVADLVQLVPQIDWRAYLQQLLGYAPAALDAQLLHTFAHHLPYFRQLHATLADFSNETIAYYIMLKFMYQLTVDLPTAADKSMHCMRLLRGYMPLAANYLYEQQHYKFKRRATDAALHAMYNRLRAHFKQLISANQLNLSATERDFVSAELTSMQLKIGNIPRVADAQLEPLIAQYYRGLRMNATDFYANHLQLLKFNVRRMQARLANVPTSADFYENDFETASSSSPVKIFYNAVLVPYGYLQLPLYDYRLDSLYQYSLFGFILAHELMHAYDLFHIVYDAHGDYNELGIAVAQHYWPYINCSGQPELNDVLSENMADVVGLRLAYETYFDTVGADMANDRYEGAVIEVHKKTDVVADVAAASTNKDTTPAYLSAATTAAADIHQTSAAAHFTHAQLFFINSVQFLCANMPRIATLDVDALNLGHDMHDVRVRRNWANVEHFAAAFECAPDAKMNPTAKCRLW